MEKIGSLNTVIQAQAISKSFTVGGGLTVQALDKVSLDIGENNFICLLGPSGCGKSTLLRIIAGLEKSSDGTVLYRGGEQSRPRREIGVIFQEYSLFPWRNVIDNVTFGLELAGLREGKRREQGKYYLDMVGLAKYERAYPNELSGGMRQRVAIARALVNQPDVLLMDEPFGALDAYTRIRLQKNLLDIWEKDKKTVLFVTHSVDEAVFLADRIVVMSSNPGRILTERILDLPRPRSRDNPAYAALVADILNLLEQETNDD